MKNQILIWKQKQTKMEFCDGLHRPYPLFCQENWSEKSDSISKIQKFWRNYKFICKIKNFIRYYKQETTVCMLPGCNKRHYDNKKAKEKHMKREHKISKYTFGAEQVFKYIKNNDYTGICSICKKSLSNGETISHLPNCPHPFHKKCIDDRGRCPTCNATAGIEPFRIWKWEPDIFRVSIAHSTLCYEYIYDYQCYATTNLGHRCTHRAWDNAYCGKHQ